MGMPCEVNSLLKLTPAQGYPESLALGQVYHCVKSGYRILPVDAAIPLVDQNWLAQADITIQRLVWEKQTTAIWFRVTRIYPEPFLTKTAESPA